MSNVNNTCVNITELFNLIDGKSFIQVKEISEKNNIRVRETESLYLLISNESVTPLDIICNGIILEKDTNRVICTPQNKLLTIEPNNQKEQIDTLLNISSKMRMEYCEDATRISLYNYKGEWFTSTTKCIDAKTSIWSSDKTFDELFWEIFDKGFVDILEPEFTYTFLLIHRDNRIVVKHKFNNLIYVNRINNNTQIEDYTNYFFKDTPKRTIRRTKEINGYTINFPLDNYFLPNKRGIIIKFLINNYWMSYQYDFSDYSKIKNIRGNVPSIRMRYLELLSDPTALSQLQYYYSENNFLFASIKHQIENLYKNVHQLYFNSHVKHNITIYEVHPLFRTLKQLHAQFLQKNIIVTLDVVINHVNSLDKNVVKKLLGWVN
jgi:hypothetical protein